MCLCAYVHMCSWVSVYVIVCEFCNGMCQEYFKRKVTQLATATPDWGVWIGPLRAETVALCRFVDVANGQERLERSERKAKQIIHLCFRYRRLRQQSL